MRWQSIKIWTGYAACAWAILFAGRDHLSEDIPLITLRNGYELTGHRI
jgi:hypothetical protein